MMPIAQSFNCLVWKTQGKTVPSFPQYFPLGHDVEILYTMHEVRNFPLPAAKFNFVPSRCHG